METSIIIAGFKDQGVLFAGRILAYAAIDSGRHVTWISSFMPEKQGGGTNCTILLGDKPVMIPMTVEPDVAIVLNEPSFESYHLMVRPGGTLVINSSMIHCRSWREDVDVVYVPANTLALAHGSTEMLNMAAVGAMLARHLSLPITAVEDAFKQHLPCAKSELLKANLRVLHGGFRAATILADMPEANVRENVVG